MIQTLNDLLETFQMTFMQRALITGCIISICCSILGVFLVLRRFSLLGDGLAHVSFGAIGLSLLLGYTPLYFTIPVVLAASLFILSPEQFFNQEDNESILWFWIHSLVWKTGIDIVQRTLSTLNRCTWLWYNRDNPEKKTASEWRKAWCSKLEASLSRTRFIKEVNW